MKLFMMLMIVGTTSVATAQTPYCASCQRSSSTVSYQNPSWEITPKFDLGITYQAGQVVTTTKAPTSTTTAKKVGCDRIFSDCALRNGDCTGRKVVKFTFDDGTVVPVYRSDDGRYYAGKAANTNPSQRVKRVAWRKDASRVYFVIQTPGNTYFHVAKQKEFSQVGEQYHLVVDNGRKEIVFTKTGEITGTTISG